MPTVSSHLRAAALAALLALGFRSSASASPASDYYINQALDRYFVLPRDAETLSLADSSSATCRSMHCLYLNPAGLGRLRSTEVGGTLGTSRNTGGDFFSDENLEQDTLLGYIAGAFRLSGERRSPPRLGTFAVGYSRYDGDATGIARSTPDGHRRSVAYGVSLFDSMAAGYAFHWYDDQLRSELADLHSHSRLLHIWGVEVDLPAEVRIGGTFELGIGMSDTEDFVKGSNGLSHLREYAGEIGAEKRFDDWRALLSFDYSRLETRGDLSEDDVSPSVVIGGSEEGNVYNIRFGLERSIGETFRIRGGFLQKIVESYKFQRPDIAPLGGNIEGPGLTAGVGFLIGGKDNGRERLRLDYGFEYLDIGNGFWEHLISLSVPLHL